MIPLGMGIDYTAGDYAQRLAPGFTFLSGQEPPYLVHCTEAHCRSEHRRGTQPIVTENVISGWWNKTQPNITMFMKFTLRRHSWVLWKYRAFARPIPPSG